MNLDDLPEFPDPANTKAMREFAVREEQLGYHYLNTDQSRAIVHFCRACITTENKKALTHQLYLDLTQEQAILLMDSLPEMEKKPPGLVYLGTLRQKNSPNKKVDCMQISQQ